jgi:hypothetical protein
MIRNPVLYHGSRYISAILRSDRIDLPSTGYEMVSLTRDPRVALHWAQVRRDDDEGCGAILVLCRTRLAQRYRIQPFRDESWFKECPRPHTRDEAEEVIWRRPIIDLGRFLVEIRHVPERKAAA